MAYIISKCKLFCVHWLL